MQDDRTNNQGKIELLSYWIPEAELADYRNRCQLSTRIGQSTNHWFIFKLSVIEYMNKLRLIFVVESINTIINSSALWSFFNHPPSSPLK